MDNPIERAVIGAAFEVYNQLGFGFLESVYEKALEIELTERNIQFQTQTAVNVEYKGRPVGNFVADLLVERTLIVELKSISQLAKIHEVQLVNYLTATGINDGLLSELEMLIGELARSFNDQQTGRDEDEVLDLCDRLEYAERTGDGAHPRIMW